MAFRAVAFAWFLGAAEAHDAAEDSRGPPCRKSPLLAALNLTSHHQMLIAYSGKGWEWTKRSGRHAWPPPRVGDGLPTEEQRRTACISARLTRPELILHLNAAYQPPLRNGGAGGSPPARFPPARHALAAAGACATAWSTQRRSRAPGQDRLGSNRCVEVVEVNTTEEHHERVVRTRVVHGEGCDRL
eukprot:g2537.t1